MFPGTYVPRYLCSPVAMYPGFCTLIVAISINRLEILPTPWYDSRLVLCLGFRFRVLVRVRVRVRLELPTVLRTYEPSDYRTFRTKSCQCSCWTFGLTNLRNDEPFISDLQTFGLQNLRTREQSPCTFDGATITVREPSDYRTFPSDLRTFDYRTFGIESCQFRCRTYEPSDYRNFGMKNLLFWIYEPSDYRAVTGIEAR